MNISIESILELDGIVIRKIPTSRISRWRTLASASLPPNSRVIKKEGKMITYERTEVYGLAGYAIQFEHTQDNTIIFNKKYSGFGSTIVEAYQDYLSKNKYSVL